ncbi:MAG: TetR family transcriptional regulator C-terminal domain-containing protein, partial [Bacteroidota bacterium]
GLIQQLVDQGQDSWDQVAQEEDPRKRLIAVFEATFHYIREKREFVKLVTGLALQIQDFPELEAFIKGRYLEQIPVYAALLEAIDIPNPREEAIALTALLDGIGMQALVLGDAFDLDSMRQHLLRRYHLL